MDVVLIGTGYVGLTTAAVLAFVGHRVTCVDVQPERVEMLRRGRIPFHEPLLDELLAASRDRLAFELAGERMPHGADVVFLTVGTPPSPDGSPDLSQLVAAARTVGASLDGRFTVVASKSTVPIGSGNWLASLLRDSVGAGASASSFAVVSNPEFLREGTAVFDSLYPDRIVVGADDPRAIEVMRRLYAPLVEQSFAAPAWLPRPAGVARVPVVETDLVSSELVKYAANAFLALKISFANEMAELSEAVGADIAQVTHALGLDARIGARFLQAGVGWGGSCFGKDTAALIATARDYGLKLPAVEAARTVNYRQRTRVVERLLAELKLLKGRTIGVLGLAFKPHTDDVRDAPAIAIARDLLARGAKVRVHDPVAAEAVRRDRLIEGAEFCESAEDVVRDADAAVLLTEWPTYRELDWERIAGLVRTRLVLDARNALDRERLVRAGFRYLGVGR